MRIVSVVGARPQFVKLAPIAAACRQAGVGHRIVHTGQHYDANMSEVFFDELRIPTPDVNLGIGSGPHGRQTGQMLERLEQVLVDEAPDWVLAYGDTNSTIATALAAVKVHLPLAHLEAGLRSFNRRMPEEHNRVLTDHASDLLLAPSEVAVDNLAGEGLKERTVHVGDVMVDITSSVARSLAEDPAPLPGPVDDGPFVLATIHRAENTDDAARLRSIIEGLASLGVPVVLAAHPRLRARALDAGIALERPRLHVVDPLPYRTMIGAVAAAAAVVTDSGGLQKEAYVLGTPCATVRTETEWLETLVDGWNVLIPDPRDLDDGLVLRTVDADRGTPYGGGCAAEAAVAALRSRT